MIISSAIYLSVVRTLNHNIYLLNKIHQKKIS